MPWPKDIFYRINLDKRKLIQVIAAQGVLHKKKIHGLMVQVNKPGINGVRKRKALVTSPILSVFVCYSFEI